MRKIYFVVPLLVVAAGASWMFRGTIRESWRSLRKPTLPQAQPYQVVDRSASSTMVVAFASTTRPTTVAPPSNKTVSTKPKTQTPTQGTSTSSDPLAWLGALPTSINLAVPFLSQAPKQDWSQPYQDACEEASAIMVDAFYKGQTTKFEPEAGDQAILGLVKFEQDLFGRYKDTTAEETAQLLRKYFGYKNVLVREIKEPNDLRKALAHRYPVIVPAYGKALGNPNFRNGGPVYHMLVVKGYLPDGRWITNDPGTRLGADYVYDADVLFKALHDWNRGDVVHGQPMMIVVLPN